MAEVGIKKWIITFTVILAALLELIDTTIVNVSLPQIMGNLGASLEDVGWVVTSYAVANVIVLPMSGWLGSKFGRKNYFLFSILAFTLFSFFCGNATNLEELVIFRIFQGLAGGGLLSTAQAILLDTWPKEEIGMATALFGLGAVVGPTLGPTIGGYITDHFSWPWIFYVNLPMGALAAFFVSTFVPETIRDGRFMKVDWWGILFLAVSVGSLQVVLEKGESEDWFDTNYIVLLSLTTVIGSLLFIWRELKIDFPVVNFKILRYRSFSVGIFTSFALGFGLYASVFVFPILAQNLLGFSAQQTGELLFPGGVATIVMMPLIGIMLRKGVPAQFMATAGMLMFFWFTYMLRGTTLYSGTSDFFWPLIIRGVGMSLLFVPLTTLAVQDLNGPEIGQGAGINNMMRQLGGSFGIAILTTLIHLRSGFHRSNLIENVTPYNPAFSERYTAMYNSFLAKGMGIDQAKAMAMRAIDLTIVKQSTLLSYTDVFVVIGLFFLCVIPFLYLQKFNKKAVFPVDAH